MLTEPVAGFQSALEEKVRNPKGKIEIVSHAFITSTTQDSSVTVDVSNTYAQSFSLPAGTIIKVMDVFISRISGFDSDIDVRILADSGGMPDTGAVLDSSAVFGLEGLRPKFHRLTFDTSITLSGSTTYWIELSTSGDLSFKWYKDSTVTGIDYALNTATVTSDQALIFKLLSTTEADNLFKLPSLMNYRLRLTSKFSNDNGSAVFSNIDSNYDEQQPLKHLLNQNTECKIYIGEGDDFLLKATVVVNAVETRETTFNLSFLGLKARLISQNVQFKSSFIGDDFSFVIIDLAIQAGLVGNEILFADNGLVADSGLFADVGTGSIDLTGITFPTGGTLDGKIIDSIIKIEQATGFEFSINNDGLPVFRERNDDLTPVFTYREDTHIIRQEINLAESRKNMFNRILINNVKTSDGEAISLAAATTLNTFSGSMLASERERTLSFNYSTEPVLGAILRNLDTDDDTDFVEDSRTAESITLTVRNLNFPTGAATYSIELVGSLVANDAASLIVVEKAQGESLKREGLIDYQIDNDLLVDSETMTKLSSRLLLLNAFSRDFFNLQTIGTPLMETGDVVKVDNEQIKDDFIFKITEENITFAHERRNFGVVYSLERYPVLEGTSLTDLFLFADDGNLADAGLFADSSQRAIFNSWI